MIAEIAGDDLGVGVQVGEYQITGKLGQGGMASVYAATHPIIGKRVAIKVLSHMMCSQPGAAARFVQEAQAVNRIGHPNIVDIFAIGTLADGRPYFVMEWLTGESLAAYIERGPIAIDVAADILDQLCTALEAVHEADIIHRDLKPDNLFLVPVRGRQRPLVKLLDFGVAKLRDTSARTTTTGMTLGTPAYMSPEQARGSDVTSASDVYALGILSYEMLTGSLPFEAESALDIMMMHVQTPPPAPRAQRADVPDALDALVLAMLAKPADARPLLPEIAATLATFRAEADGRPGRAPSLGDTSARASTSSLELRDRVERGATISTSVPATRRSSMARVLVLAFAMAVGVVMVVVATRGEPRTSVPPRQPSTLATPSNAPTSVPTDAPSEAPVSVPPTVEPSSTRGATLTLRISTPGVRIELDGAPVPDALDGTEISIRTPGDHELVATAPGYRAMRRTIRVPATGKIEESIELEPIARRPSTKRPSRPQRPSSAAPPAPARPTGDNYTLDPFKKGTP